MRIYYCPGSDLLILDTKLSVVRRMKANYNHGGVFQFTHILPLPSSHKQRWTHVSRVFSQFELCIGRGRDNYKKISKRMHSFMVACVQTPPSLLRFLVVIHVFFEH